MEKQVEFRCEQTKDIETINFIHEKAFDRDDESILVRKLRTCIQYDEKLSFVASVDSNVVGHLLFTPLEIEYETGLKTNSTLALAPISVLPEFQRKRIGTRLIEFALNEINSRGIYSSIIVLGHENFYPRFGFQPARRFHIQAPFPLKNENCFMVLELKPNVLPRDQLHATVHYLPEFGLEK